MDPVKIEKIQAINNYKKHQLLNNLFLYSLTALTCSLFCSTPFWFPPLYSSMKVFLFVSLPNIGSLFFSSKILFIIGNLIVIFLVGESKISASYSSLAANHVYSYEQVNASPSLGKFSSLDEDKKERKLEKSFEEKVSKNYEDGEDKEGKGWGERKSEVEEATEDLDGEELNLPAQEINKRADDFIAKVNKQRRLELNY